MPSREISHILFRVMAFLFSSGGVLRPLEMSRSPSTVVSLHFFFIFFWGVVSVGRSFVCQGLFFVNRALFFSSSDFARNRKEN